MCKYKHKHEYSYNTTDNSHKADATQIRIKGRVSKDNAECPHNGNVLTHKTKALTEAPHE